MLACTIRLKVLSYIQLMSTMHLSEVVDDLKCWTDFMYGTVTITMMEGDIGVSAVPNHHTSLTSCHHSFTRSNEC